MFLDVKELEELQAALSKFKSRLDDHGDIQVVDATIAVVNEQLMFLESDD